MQSGLICLLIHGGTDVVHHSWPDVEGASLVRTMQKAWGEDMPSDVGDILCKPARIPSESPKPLGPPSFRETAEPLPVLTGPFLVSLRQAEDKSIARAC